MPRERLRQKRRRQAQDRARALVVLLTLAAVVLSFYRVYWSVAIFVAGLLMLAVTVLRGTSARMRAMFLGGYAVLAAMFLWWPLRAQHREELANQLAGELRVPKPAAEAPLVQIGSSPARFVWTANPTSPIFGFFRSGEKNLNIEVVNREIQISTEVRDSDGNLLLKIDHNKWNITPSAVSDYNYTRDALEVMDRRNHVLFQAHLLPDHIELQGEWRDNRGQGLELVQCPDPQVADFVPLAARQNRDVAIAPLFRYPRSERWAEWNKNRLRQLPDCEHTMR